VHWETTQRLIIGGEDAAKRIQLITEYDPHPPSDAGIAEKASQELRILS
jgi:hypothetical protein